MSGGSCTAVDEDGAHIIFCSIGDIFPMAAKAYPSHVISAENIEIDGNVRQLSVNGSVSAGSVACAGDITATATAPTISILADGSDNRDATLTLRGRYLGADVEKVAIIGRYSDNSSFRTQGGLYFEKYVSDAVTSASGYTWPSDARRDVAKISYDGSFANCGVYPMYSSTAASETPIWDVGSSDSRYKNCYLAVSPTVSSDRRLKDEITEMKGCLDFVTSLRPSTYKMKNSNKKSRRIHAGFVADEVLECLKRYGCTDSNPLSSDFSIYTHPRERKTVQRSNGEQGETVEASPDVDAYTSLRYSEFIPFLVGAVKELQAEIVRLHTRIEALEASPYDAEKRQRTS
jgi:hypothetical protein